MSCSGAHGWKRWQSSACDTRISLTPRVDPLDQTSVTYMDSGETIPCDLVVLKDPQGNLITIT